MVPWKFILRNNRTGAHSGAYEDPPGVTVDKSSWLDSVNIQQYWVVK